MLSAIASFIATILAKLLPVILNEAKKPDTYENSSVTEDDERRQDEISDMR